MSSTEGELCWEVNDMEHYVADGAGLRDSPTTVTIGGLEWKLRIVADCSPRTANVRSLGIFLLCLYPEAKRFWRCEAQYTITLVNSQDATRSRGGQALAGVFYPDTGTMGQGYYGTVSMDALMDDEEGFLVDDKINVKVHISVTKTQGVGIVNNVKDFSEANERTDLCLIVENKRVHVTKAILAEHSPVFQKMFYGSFEENGKREVELKDVDHKEFVDLLNVIYTSLHEINDESVEGILVLADRFHMKIVLEAAGIFLMINSRRSTPKRLLLTDIYKLDQAQAHLIYSIKTPCDMKAVQKSDEYRKFSDVLKARVCDRAAEFP